MKTGLKISGAIAVVLMLLYIAAKAFSFVSMPSDFAVIAGILLFLVLIVVISMIFTFIIKKLNKESKS